MPNKYKSSKDKNRIDRKVEQKFCPNCGGVTSIKIDGDIIEPLDYPKYEFASDLGCVC